MTKPTQAAQTAARSSFYTGMRILPRAQREAMFEIYSFCRAADDIADDLGPREGRRAQGIVGRPGVAALAVHVEHETADWHRRQRAVTDEIVPVAIATSFRC